MSALMMLSQAPRWPFRPRGRSVVVLRRELGATTCHVFPVGERGELADLVLGGKPGSELQITPCQFTASSFWTGEVTR